MIFGIVACVPPVTQEFGAFADQTEALAVADFENGIYQRAGNLVPITDVFPDFIVSGGSGMGVGGYTPTVPSPLFGDDWLELFNSKHGFTLVFDVTQAGGKDGNIFAIGDEDFSANHFIEVWGSGTNQWGVWSDIWNLQWYNFVVETSGEFVRPTREILAVQLVPRQNLGPDEYPAIDDEFDTVMVRMTVDQSAYTYPDYFDRAEPWTNSERVQDPVTAPLTVESAWGSFATWDTWTHARLNAYPTTGEETTFHSIKVYSGLLSPAQLLAVAGGPAADTVNPFLADSIFIDCDSDLYTVDATNA